MFELQSLSGKETRDILHTEKNVSSPMERDCCLMRMVQEMKAGMRIELTRGPEEFQADVMDEPEIMHSQRN